MFCMKGQPAAYRRCRITTQIMLQFESVVAMPRVSFRDVGDLVDERLATEASARQLPRLHRAAALFALRSLCAEAPRVPQAARCGPASFLPPFLVGPAEGDSSGRARPSATSDSATAP
jgi:hypothetical protein